MSREQGGEQARRARHSDRDERTYEWRRRQAARRRASQERREFDPAPPSDEDWTTPDPGSDGLRRVTPPDRVASTLDRLIEQRGWSERLRGTRIFTHWERIVGEELATRCEPVRVAGGTLVVRAASQVWATQLRYLGPSLVTSANEVLGDGTVREVRIVVGNLGDGQESS